MQARFRFYAELNDFLPPPRRMVAFDFAFDGRQTVKHLIESMGVPHTEVDLVLINGRSVGFGELVGDGDSISVYPVFEALDIAPLSKVRPRPLRRTRFILDTHLGRLAAYLRMIGFDTLYGKNSDDEDLARVSAAEHRILLTRDRGLLKRGAVTHGYCIRESNARLQLGEVVRRFDLAGSMAPFTRCMVCNHPLRDVATEQADCTGVRECPQCNKLFWDGSHYRRMQQMIEALSRTQQ